VSTDRVRPPIVDAHQHFWKIARGDYSWMDDSVAPIRKDFLPEDLESLAKPVGVLSTVVVQAAPTVAETEFLLSLAADHALISGVVGWVDLEADDMPEILLSLAADPRLKGIRPFLEYIEDPNWILNSKVRQNLLEIERAGLTFDALVRPRHFEAITQLADAFPDLKIVIDHCGKPEIGGGKDPGREWRAAIDKLANHRNVYCKLSGLVTEVGAGWTSKALSPVCDHVLSAFGCERVMWGSDWPVVELAGTYEGWLKCTDDLLVMLSAEERASVLSGTACQFYSLA